MLICVTCVCCFGLMITGFACFGFAFVWGCLLVVAVFQCCVCVICGLHGSCVCRFVNDCGLCCMMLQLC